MIGGVDLQFSSSIGSLLTACDCKARADTKQLALNST